ncbi:hypothetical protein [Allocoleopsis sp.]|uniref:hypothetical protein n=1 Tax=Allocoleopsis sp. TaxID=3088169 RepID=UPI002FD5D461
MRKLNGRDGQSSLPFFLTEEALICQEKESKPHKESRRQVFQRGQSVPHPTENRYISVIVTMRQPGTEV